MVFALAGTTPGEAQRLLDTPVAEVCRLYLNYLQLRAREDYDRALNVWANQSAYSKARPPEVPSILR